MTGQKGRGKIQNGQPTPGGQKRAILYELKLYGFSLDQIMHSFPLGREFTESHKIFLRHGRLVSLAFCQDPSFAKIFVAGPGALEARHSQKAAPPHTLFHTLPELQPAMQRVHWKVGFG
jgi:hypothetical protein